MTDFPNDKKIILFDGICNLCNTSVQRIIRFDVNQRFLFTSIQSNIGQEIIRKIKLDTAITDSIILYNPDSQKFKVKSSAILQIAVSFGGLWNLTNIFWLVPTFIRDFCYDFIAKNRYRWFGKKHSCMVPEKSITSRFLA